MAATRLIALHINKGKTIAQCLRDRTDYAQNPEKTEKGELVSGYECDPMTADEEFLLAKRQYLHITGRRQQNDVIAYQIRQSFKPGEITPEEANRVGYELGMRFTKGKHAFLVATHTDRAHIHNHIIFNSTSLDCKRKFRDFHNSGLALQKVSDIICMEHGLSIIEKKPYKERIKRTTYPKRHCFRDEIRQAIDRALLKKPKDFEEFLRFLEQDGYTCKRGKHTALWKEGQDRFTGDLPVPEEMGGGLWSDGNNQINQWIAGSSEMNPVTGEYFEPNLWSSTIEMNQTATTKEWSEKFGAVNEVEYMKNAGQLGMVANVNIPLASDDTDTALIRSQCKSVVCDASWRMVFAANDAEFEQMWDDMCTQLEGFGWNDLVAFDTEKYQAVIDARKAAE